MDRIQKLWASGCLGKLAIGFVGFVILSCVLSPFTSRSQAPAATGSAAEPTEVAGAAAAATDAPEPTAAPTEEPTNTPEPTAEPTVNPTAVARIALAAYGQSVYKEITTIGEGLQSISQLSGNATFTDEWKIQMAVGVTQVRSGHEALTKIEPPDAARDVHTQLLAATSDCNTAMDYLVKGIDTLDSDELTTASQLMQSCGTKTREVTPAMHALAAP